MNWCESLGSVAVIFEQVMSCVPDTKTSHNSARSNCFSALHELSQIYTDKLCKDIPEFYNIAMHVKALL